MKGNGKSGSGFKTNLLISKLAHHDLLDAAEERKLIRRAKRKDHGALTKLILMNVRLVMRLALKFGGQEHLDDLLPEGIIGLIKGIFKYDLKRPEKPRLSTYATHWIEHSIRRYLTNNHRTVRLPVHVEELSWKVSKETIRCLTATGAMPSVEELTERINASLALADEGKEKPRHVTAKAVARAKEAAEMRFVAVNHTDHSFEFGAAAVASETHLAPDFELVLPEEGENALGLVERAEAIEVVRQAMSALSPNQQAVIQLRFIEGMTLEDSAVALHERGITATEITRERVRQIQERALDTLRPKLIRAGLAPDGFVYVPKQKGRPRRVRTRD